MIMAKYSDKSATKIFLFIQSSLDFSKKKNDSLLFLYLIPLFRMFPVSYTRYTKPGTYKRIIHSWSLFSLRFWAKRGVNWRTMDKTNLWNDGNPNTMASRWETCAPLVSTRLSRSGCFLSFSRACTRGRDFLIKRKKKDRNHRPQRLNKFQWQAAHEWKSIEDHEREEKRNFEAYNTQINQRQINHCNPHIFCD